MKKEYKVVLKVDKKVVETAYFYTIEEARAHFRQKRFDCNQSYGTKFKDEPMVKDWTQNGVVFHSETKSEMKVMPSGKEVELIIVPLK